MKITKKTITITESGDEIPTHEVLTNEAHFLEGSIDAENKDIYLSFSSKLAMYDFARTLLQESIFGFEGRKEFIYLSVNGKNMVSDGVRLSEKSSRIFIEYPANDSSMGENLNQN